MNFTNSRSQFVRTSQKSRYQGRNGLLPVYVNNIEETRSKFERNSQESVERQKLQQISKSKTKEELIQKISLTKFNSTVASTFNQHNRPTHRVMSSDEKFRPASQSSIFNRQLDNSTQRPSTQFKTHRNFEIKQRFVAFTPLEVLKKILPEDKIPSQNGINIVSSQILQKTKKESLSEELGRLNYSSQTKKVHNNFLKKRTSFDRTLLHNILKLKFRQNLVNASQNYSNHLPNTLLHSKIKHRIPNQFRDIIGPEQMLRMTRILSGISIKTTDMNSKIKTAITSRQIKTKIKTSNSAANDDLQTLKSIKRW